MRSEISSTDRVLKASRPPVERRRMVDGKRSFIYHQTQPQSNQHQKIWHDIIHITRHKNCQVAPLLGSTFNRLPLMDLITQVLREEHHSQALYNLVVPVPQLPLLRLRPYQLYLKSRIPPKSNPTPHDLRRPAKLTAILGPVLLVWIKPNTSPLSTPLRVPNTRHRPAIDTRHLRQPKGTLDTHRSV